MKSDSGRKRRKDEAEKPRKRFVWPENLHRDFISSVFDVGLRAASPSQIHDLLPPKEGGAAISAEHIRGQLHKFKLLRNRERGGVSTSFTDQYSSILYPVASFSPSILFEFLHYHHFQNSISYLSSSLPVLYFISSFKK